MLLIHDTLVIYIEEKKTLSSGHSKNTAHARMKNVNKQLSTKNFTAVLVHFFLKVVKIYK